ncbi:MAG: riboflavin synthase [Alphaproteobacteria bacterium]|nr:riboflavin synthase [Alphaproteobacteria bacterium]
MFTGIIIDIGVIKKITKKDEDILLSIYSSNIKGFANGMSISCSGICLTVIDFIKNETGYIFNVYVSKETLSKTNLGNLIEGDHINLEKSLSLGDEMSGHIVQGHIDGVVKIKNIESVGDSKKFCFVVDSNLMKFIAPKGSVSLDGTSLTVNNVYDSEFEINFIPYTLEHTTWKYRNIGDLVNIEVDILARYVLKGGS